MPAKQQQYNVVIASFLGWTLDAFDFFLLTFCLTTIAASFHASRKERAFQRAREGKTVPGKNNSGIVTVAAITIFDL